MKKISIVEREKRVKENSFLSFITMIMGLASFFIAIVSEKNLFFFMGTILFFCVLLTELSINKDIIIIQLSSDNKQKGSD